MYYHKCTDLQIDRSTFYCVTDHHYLALFDWWNALLQQLQTQIFMEVYFLIHRVYVSVKYYFP